MNQIIGLRTARNAALSALLAAASFGASAALTTFTLDPGAVGLQGASPFTADNLLISDYATVNRLPGNKFEESGYLSISGATLNNKNLVVPGLNADYGLFIHFSGSGTLDGKDPLFEFSSGTFDTLTYEFYGYNGTASFGFNGTQATTTATNLKLLASGTLVSGGVYSIPAFPLGTSFYPGGAATVSFDVAASGASFFSVPAPFFNQALTSFTNTPSQVEFFAGGFMINSGGGSINFVAAVPEPETYAMLLAGLGVVGFVAGRRIRRGSKS